MPRTLGTPLGTGADVKRNAEAMRTLVGDLRALVGKVAQGGPESARTRHVARTSSSPASASSGCSIRGAPFSRSASSPRTRSMRTTSPPPG